MDMDENTLRAGLDSCLLTDEEMRLGPDAWQQWPTPFEEWLERQPAF